MKSTLIAYLVVLSFFSSFAQDKTIPSSIKEVTVYQSSAHITRVSERFPVDRNTQKFLIQGISPYMDQKSLTVRLTGDAYLVSINVRANYLYEKKASKRVEDLEDNIEKIQDSIDRINLEIKTLDTKEEFLKINKNIAGKQTGIDLSNLKDIHEYYSSELATIYQLKYDYSAQKGAMQSRITRLKEEKNNWIQDHVLPPKDVEIELSAPSATHVILECSYLVKNAGWYSSYDLRAKEINQPIQLVHKANIYQNTGENWDSVMLRLSNDRAQDSKVLPKLHRLILPPVDNRHYSNPSAHSRINFVKGRVLNNQGEPLIGAMVSVGGLDKSTTTDLDGYYELYLPSGFNTIEASYVGYEKTQVLVNRPIEDIVMAERGVLLESAEIKRGSINIRGQRNKNEVYYVDGERVRGAENLPNGDNQTYNYRVRENNIVESQLNYTFNINTPYSIESDGKVKEVYIRELQLEADYMYSVVPKLSSSAYLTAYIDNWEDKNLLEGNINLYFEDNYIGQSVLNPRQLKDSMQISLGVDTKIECDRERIRYFTKKNFLSKKKTSYLEYKNAIRNLKNTTIKVEIWDQIPISRLKEIEVEKDNITPGFMSHPETGIGKWVVELSPNELKEFNMGFNIKYDSVYNFVF